MCNIIKGKKTHKKILDITFVVPLKDTKDLPSKGAEGRTIWIKQEAQRFTRKLKDIMMQFEAKPFNDFVKVEIAVVSKTPPRKDRANVIGGISECLQGIRKADKNKIKDVKASVKNKLSTPVVIIDDKLIKELEYKEVFGLECSCIIRIKIL